MIDSFFFFSLCAALAELPFKGPTVQTRETMNDRFGRCCKVIPY